jgi:hypothetical protein
MFGLSHTVYHTTDLAAGLARVTSLVKSATPDDFVSVHFAVK